MFNEALKAGEIKLIDTLKQWHDIVENRNSDKLHEILDKSVAMVSPVVYTPQIGRVITKKYLSAALNVIGNKHFKYVREISNADGAMLEFETEVDGIYVNGVDIISWNEQGLITEFKVMLRPLQAVNIIQKKMMAMLQKAESS